MKINLSLPDNTLNFVKDTLNLCEMGKPHEVAASFFYGREDPIPKMFTNILNNLDKRGIECSSFKLYIQRHIEVDGGSHGLLAEEMLLELCGDDEIKWIEVQLAAEKSIQSRIRLWNGILEEIEQRL